MNNITVEELHKRKENGENPFLLDVRELFEYDIANLEGEIIPLGELEFRLYEIEDRKEEEIIVYCRTGSRSTTACDLLQSNGFSNVRNLDGGINEWAQKIDPTMPVY